MRASISVTPPGDAGTMMVIGFEGSVCAWAFGTAARHADTAAMRSHDFIAVPPLANYLFFAASTARTFCEQMELGVRYKVQRGHVIFDI
jgi:hypothetical protein